MKNGLLISLLLTVCALTVATAQQRKSGKDIFLTEKGCPLVSTSPVTGSTLEFKNVAEKTITHYRLACFQRVAKGRRVDLVFEESEYTAQPGESFGEFGFDATPPNVCRWRKQFIGVYEVKFSDGTSWKTSGLR